MTRIGSSRSALTMGLWLGIVVAGAEAQTNDGPPQVSAVLDLNGRQATVRRLESLPLISSDYTRRFQFDRSTNPLLKELRERFQLDQVVASGVDEFDRQVLLLDWVHHRFPRFGRPTSEARGALAILEAIEEGHTFFCAHYADVLISAAASLGWVDRPLALRRPDAMGAGATEHASTEIWSNQYGKWVMFDPTFAMYVEKDGVPLNAFELRQEWFYHHGQDLTFVIGKERRKYRTADLPIFRRHFPGFGDLEVNASGALNVYAFIGYIPNTNLMDAGRDFARMFITQDQLCEGTRWHTRTVPDDPARDPYFPIGQAALTLTPESDQLRVTLQTLTPNFQSYLIRIDDGPWNPTDERFVWRLHAGLNRLEAKTVNRFGVVGPVSVAEVELAP